MTYLIDGFNLIYKFPDLEALMYENRLIEARQGLLARLKEYQRITGARMRVVFDGKKEKSLELKNEMVGTIDVYYSLEYSADHLIKEFIKKDGSPRATTVVTSDKDILFFVNRFKAKVKTSEEFASHINETIQKWIESQTPEKEDDPVLSRDEISYWERLFKKKKSDP